MFLKLESAYEKIDDLFILLNFFFLQSFASR